MHLFYLVFYTFFVLFPYGISAAEKNGLTKKEQEEFERLQKKMGAYQENRRNSSILSAPHQDLMSRVPTSMMMGLFGENASTDQLNQLFEGRMAPKLTRKTTLQQKKRFSEEKKMSRDEDKAQNPKDYSGTQLRSTEEDPTAQKLTQVEDQLPKEVQDAMRKVVGSKQDGVLERFLLKQPKELLDEITERVLELHRCMKGVAWRDVAPQIIQFVDKLSEISLLKVTKYFQMAKDYEFGAEIWKKTLLQLLSIENEEEIIELASRIEGDVEKFKEKERRLPIARKAMHVVVGANQEDAVLEEFFVHTEEKNLEILAEVMRNLWHGMRGVPWSSVGKHIIAIAQRVDVDLFSTLEKSLSYLGEHKFLTVEWEGWFQKLAIASNNKILEVAKEIVSEAEKKSEIDKKMPIVLEAMIKIPLAQMDDKLKAFLLRLKECDIFVTTERLADLISYMPEVRWDVIADSVLALVQRIDLETFLAFNIQMEKMKTNKADSTKWDMWFRSLEKLQGKQIVEAAKMMVCIQDMLEDKKHFCIRNFSDRIGKLPLDLWSGLKAHLEEAKSKLSSSNSLVGLLTAFNSYAGIAADKMKVKAVNIE